MKLVKKWSEMLFKKEEPKIIFSSTPVKKEEFNPSVRHEEKQQGGTISFEDFMKHSIFPTPKSGILVSDDVVKASLSIAGKIDRFVLDPTFFEALEQEEDPSKR